MSLLQRRQRKKPPRISLAGAPHSGDDGTGAPLALARAGTAESAASSELPAAEVTLERLQAWAELCQASSCDTEEQLRNWTCKSCPKVGFQVVPGTASLVRTADIGLKDAIVVYVTRVQRLSRPAYPADSPRQREPLKHKGVGCWRECGQKSGWCAWCGIGNACCHPTDMSQNSAECVGAAGYVNNTALETHVTNWKQPKVDYQCVAPVVFAPPAPVQQGWDDCFDMCGQAEGFCKWCGAGNACCRRGSMDAPLECHGVKNFATSGYECVAPVSTRPQVAALDVGCAMSFRGTHNLANTLKDIMFFKTALQYSDCEGCEVHSGFHSIWEGIEYKLVRVLADNGCVPGTPQGSLLITGHSLGAAVATLAMFTLQARGYSVEQAFNFGSPRVGNSAFSQAFGAWFASPVPLYRVTHGEDPVSQIPPTPMFKHVQSEVYFPTDSLTEYTVCHDVESDMCQARHGTFIWFLFHMNTDHHCHIPLGVGSNFCHCPA